MIDFNPRLPWGRRLRLNHALCLDEVISIHAFRGEGDLLNHFLKFIVIYFNPRLPWGRRLFTLFKDGFTVKFQSTPSVGKATW